MIQEIDNSMVKNRLIELKAKSNFTNEEISIKANVAPGTVNDHFNKSKPAKDIKSDILYKYSKLFDVTVDYLLTGENVATEQSTEKDNTITPEKIFESINVLMAAYGADCFRTDYGGNGEYDYYYLEMNIMDKILIDYVEKIKSVIEQRELLEKLGVYNQAIEIVKADILSKNPVYLNRDRNLAYLKLIDELDGDLPF